MPVLVKPKNFEAEVLDAGLPVLVDFFGERCVPCHMQRPVLLELGEEFAGQLKICMFNTDKERRDTAEDCESKFRTLVTYNVMHLPTLLLFMDGGLRRTLIGLHTKQELLDVLGQEGLALQPDVGGQPCANEGKGGGEDEQGNE